MRFVADEAKRGFEIEDVANDGFAANVHDLKTEAGVRFDSERKKASGVGGTQVNVAGTGLAPMLSTDARSRGQAPRRTAITSRL